VNARASRLRNLTGSAGPAGKPVFKDSLYGAVAA
jgi:hypothetical protein